VNEVFLAGTGRHNEIDHGPWKDDGTADASIQFHGRKLSCIVAVILLGMGV
jgi:hypothetical protein